METKDRDAGPSHVAKRGPVVLDLLVTACQAQHRLMVEMDWHILDRFEDKAILPAALHQAAKVSLLPVRLPRDDWGVELDACDADLRRIAKFLVR